MSGIYTYGSIDFPTYNIENLIYAKSGVCVAFVYPRGSGEKGKKWYLDGKMLNKKNTFSDYLACVEFLKEQFKLTKNQIIGYGTSAGGIIMGVAANMRPDLFGGIIFDKPYCNLIETMSNTKLPLTTLEYSEFGNINDSIFYNYIKSYDPYQNVKGQNFPNMMFLAKYHDMNTPYWNVAKQVIKYRKSVQNNPLIIFNTDLQAGHRGNVNYLTEVDYKADMFAFVMYTINSKD